MVLRFLLLSCLIVLWIISGVSQLLIIARRKPGIKLFQARLLFNPFLMQFGGHYYLTEAGIFWRNVSWVCTLLFVLGVTATILYLGG